MRLVHETNVARIIIVASDIELSIWTPARWKNQSMVVYSDGTEPFGMPRADIDPKYELTKYVCTGPVHSPVIFSIAGTGTWINIVPMHTDACLYELTTITGTGTSIEPNVPLFPEIRRPPDYVRPTPPAAPVQLTSSTAVAAPVVAAPSFLHMSHGFTQSH